jgi:hypothetical protein
VVTPAIENIFQTPVDRPGGICGNNHKLEGISTAGVLSTGFSNSTGALLLDLLDLISNQIFYYPLTWISYYLHSFHAFVYLA